MGYKSAAAAVAAIMFAFSAPAQAQDGPRAIVSLYHAAPGQQVALLKWLADQDRAAAAAGIPKSQLYVHTSGDSWDYLIIAPVTTEAQDKAVDAAAQRLGLSIGPRASIEFRKYILTHTDTMSQGPTSAADILARLGEK
jgi:hypothetical protein